MEEICASIMQAACEGRVSDVESLVLSNNIDVNACLFVREELELTSKEGEEEFRVWGPAKNKETRPLLHAWLFNCFRNFDPECLAFSHGALNVEKRYEMIKMMVQKLGAKPLIMIMDPLSTATWFNAMDFAWILCGYNRAAYIFDGEDDHSNLTATTAMQLAEICGEDEFSMGHEANQFVLATLCSLFASKMVERLLEIKFGGALWAKNPMLLRMMFSRESWTKNGLAYKRRCDSIKIMQMVISAAGKETLMEQHEIVSHIIELQKTSSGPYPYMAEMLLNIGVGHREVLAVKENNNPYDIKWYLPTSDPIERLVFRSPAIKSDINEREKLGLFFSKSEWGKLLGRDIVQAHILPHVVVLGGIDHKRIDAILLKYKVPYEVLNNSIHTFLVFTPIAPQVWECPFYYDCVIKRTQSLKIIEEFLFLECMMSPQGVADCKRMKKAMRRVATEFGMQDISSLILTAMRGRAHNGFYQEICGYRQFSRPSALGAVPERCAQPPTVSDSREYVNWVDLVWG